MKIKIADNIFRIYSINKRTTEYDDWLSFYFAHSFNLSFDICGYFDNRPRINISLLFFSLTLVLPFRNKWIDECDPPKWGIAVHNEHFWLYKGGKGNDNGGNDNWAWDIPFIAKNWVRESLLLENDEWIHCTDRHKVVEFSMKWEKRLKKWTYDFTDYGYGTVVPCEITVEENEYRYKWLEWTSLFAEVSRRINVEFSEEIGPGKETWKGGMIGSSYTLRPDEDPIDCIKRIEKEIAQSHTQ